MRVDTLWASQMVEQAFREAEARRSKDVWIARAEPEAKEATLRKEAAARGTQAYEVTRAIRRASTRSPPPHGGAG